MWKCKHVRMDFCRCFLHRALTAPKREWCFPAGRYERRRGKRWFPTGRAISAEGGVAVHRGADHVELPRLARPKGCFVTSAAWS